MNLDTQLALIEYLQVKPWMMPDIVRGETFVYSTTLSEAAKIRLLTAARTAAEEATAKRKHKKGAKPEVYAIFRSLAGDDAVLIDKDTFDILLEAATGIALSEQDLSCPGAIVRAVDSLRDAGESDDAIITFLQSIASADKRFLSAMHYTPPSPEDADPLRRFERQGIYSNAFKAIGVRKESIRDALCYLTLAPEYNDVELECRAVLPCVLTSPEVQKSDALIIIEPSVFAFRRFLATNIRTKHQTLFVFHDPDVAKLLQTLYHRLNLDILHDDELKKVLNARKTRHCTWLLFGNTIPSVSNKAEWIEAAKNALAERLSLFIFNGDFELMNERSPLFQALTDMTPASVRTFPSGLTCSTAPARKLLMQFEYGYNIPTDKVIQVIQYTQSNDDRNHYRLTIKPFMAAVPVEDYCSGNYSFRRFYREEEVKEYSKHTGLRARHEIHFIDNIMIHYTLSDVKDKDGSLRIKAYIVTPDGEYMKETERRLSGIDRDKVIPWLLHEYPYVKSRRKPNRSVQQAMADRADLFLSANSTLHAFIYLTPTLEDALPGYASDVLSHLASSPLGEYPLRQIREEVLRSFAALLPEDAPFTPRQAINILRIVFKRAIEMKLCTENPALAIKDFDHETDENLSAVKNNLSRKFLTDRQFRHAIEISLQRIRKGQSVYLAVLIKLMTGLQSNCISALRWEDIVINDAFPNLTQILVRRQCETVNGKIRKFTERSSYRKIPCAAGLAEELFREKERQRKNDELSEDELLTLPVISGKTEIDGRKIVLPSELNKLCRKLLAELKFELEPYVFPIGKNTTRYFDRINSRWTDETQDEYVRDYNTKIFPCVSQSQPAEDLDEDALESRFFTLLLGNFHCFQMYILKRRRSHLV